METFLSITSAMTDVHFTLKDIFYIGGIAGTFLTAWHKLKTSDNTQDIRLKSLETNVSKIESEVDKNKEKFAEDLIQVNSLINEVKGDTQEIKGMITMLLNQKK